MKHHRSVLFASLAAFFALSACAASKPAEIVAVSDSADRGQAIAEQHCAQCHAIGVEGASPVASAPRWSELVVVRDVDSLAESFAEGSFVHSDGPIQMPEFTLAPAEIDDLLTYMKSLRQG